MKTKNEVQSKFDEMTEGIENNNTLLKELLVDQDIVSTATSTQNDLPPPVTERKQQSLKASRKRNGSDSCIARNVSNGEQVTEILLTFTGYETREAIMPTALAAKNVLGNTFLDTVTETKQNQKADINQRQGVYVNIPKLARRVRSMAIALGLSKKVIIDITHYVDLTTGKRIIKRKEDDPRKKISASHTTMSQKVQYMKAIIEILKTEPLYTPVKADLTIVALENTVDAMKTTSTDTYGSTAGYHTSLVHRNEFFNAEYTGYVDTYVAVKNAVKAIYGGRSPQYKQISGFKFTRIKTR